VKNRILDPWDAVLSLGVWKRLLELKTQNCKHIAPPGKRSSSFSGAKRERERRRDRRAKARWGRPSGCA